MGGWGLRHRMENLRSHARKYQTKYKKIPKTLFTIFIQIWFKRHPEEKKKGGRVQGRGERDGKEHTFPAKKKKKGEQENLLISQDYTFYAGSK